MQEFCTEIDYENEEKCNFNALLTELSKSLRQYNLEFSAVVSPNPKVAAVAYDPEVLTATLDWMAIAANDYYWSTNSRTEYLLPLQSSAPSEVCDYVSKFY